MTLHLLPVLFGLAVWWGTTVLVVFLDGLPRRTFRWSLAGATAVLALALAGLWVSARAPTTAGAYAAFACGVLVWGWCELSFYTGWITGPRPLPCPTESRGWARFARALRACLWHELALVGCAAAAAALTWGAPNKVGLGVFLVLWLMHTSARLNVFLGVRNLQEEFLPAHMAWLRSYCRKRPMNWLFPVSVTAGTALAVALAWKGFAPGEPAHVQAGFTLLAAFTALGVLEHWLLVLPWNPVALFAVGLTSRSAASPPAGAVIPFDPQARPAPATALTRAA
ncbi:MAG: DUF3623 domain-containing protein [Caulobacteraceae bacterium]|nr:DUF3623 domain-containing protein [Caulobacter sp.]